MIYKTFKGNRILFIGPKEEITPLFNSAYNWGAIDVLPKKIEFADSETDNECLLDMGNFKGFSVKTNKITRWRVNTLLTKFDVDRLISRRLIRKLIRQAKNWLNTFDVIPQWQLQNAVQVYQYTITPTPKRIGSECE